MQDSSDFRLTRENRQSLQHLFDIMAHSGQLGPGTHISHVLTLLLIAQNKNLTVTDLARHSGQTLAATSRHIKRLRKPPGSDLEGKGFVSVGGDPDARLKRLRLSPRGREWVNEGLSLLFREKL
ncbi:MAG: winged helix-turn-helix transcriptional regulator [Burkholderiales bacterium]|nr:winged helix-turn-helix transcriptional regulator [Burkholderiales bacterium]